MNDSATGVIEKKSTNYLMTTIIVMSVIVTFVSLLLWGAYRMKNKPVPKMTIDMTRRQRITDIPWFSKHDPKMDLGINLFTYETPCNVLLIMPDDKEYSTLARSIFITTEKGWVISTKINSPMMDIHQSHGYAKEILTQYGCSSDHIDQWYRKMSKLSTGAAYSDSHSYYVENKRDMPRFGLGIRKTFDKKTPWSVMFSHYWGLKEQEALEKQMKEKGAATQTKATP